MKHYIIIFAVLLFAAGCDKDFVEINTDPYAVIEIDPALLFAGAQRSHLGTWEAEHTIVQQFVNPYNQGATLGFNFNEDIDGVSNPKWNESYTGPIRNLTHAITLLGEDTERTNLLSMIRIWKAQVFMGIVDNYGNVPYFDAGKAVSDVIIYYPAYDSDAAIYDDLHAEITAALAALNPSGDYVSEDLFYGANAENSTGGAAAQVAQWRKLGNSILLRLGMRYSKANPSRAQQIVTQAFSGGVMTSNADNAYVKYDGTAYVYDVNNNLRNFSHFNYAAEPFVEQLKSTNDPRGQYILATYINPGEVQNDPDPDTDLANQFGVPIGEDNARLANDSVTFEGFTQPHRGARGSGLNYSQMNIYSVAAPEAPAFYVTYAQTSLLLAEAALRGWVTGDAQTYYEDGIRADMQAYALYPRTTAISNTEVNDYLAEPDVDISLANTDEEALALINTQYWVVNIRNGTEAFANFRRSGYPALSPNLINNNLQGGFARRMSYPDREASANAASYSAAHAVRSDNLTSRVFWDVP